MGDDMVFEHETLLRMSLLPTVDTTQLAAGVLLMTVRAGFIAAAKPERMHGREN